MKTTHGREKTVQVRRHTKCNAIDMATQSRHFTPYLIIMSLLHINTIANKTTPKTQSRYQYYTSTATKFDNVKLKVDVFNCYNGITL